jgi:hypothetical protein
MNDEQVPQSPARPPPEPERMALWTALISLHFRLMQYDHHQPSLRYRIADELNDFLESFLAYPASLVGCYYLVGRRGSSPHPDYIESVSLGEKGSSFATNVPRMKSSVEHAPEIESLYERVLSGKLGG